MNNFLIQTYIVIAIDIFQMQCRIRTTFERTGDPGMGNMPKWGIQEWPTPFLDHPEPFLGSPEDPEMGVLRILHRYFLKEIVTDSMLTCIHVKTNQCYKWETSQL